MSKYMMLAVALILVSCGELKKKADYQADSGNLLSQKSTVDANQFMQNISGIWRGPCILSQSEEPSSKAVTIAISGKQISYTVHTYNDVSCKEPRNNIRYAGSILPIQKSQNIAGNAYMVETKYNQSFLTEFEEEGVAFYNDSALSLCGFTDWTVGIEKEISTNMPRCGIAFNAAESMMKSPFHPTIVISNNTLHYYDSDTRKSPSFVGKNKK